VLEIKPRSWNADNENALASTAPNFKGLSQYLTSIIASPLAWIDDESARELIWEEASSRLSERSGRTAMKSLDRSFRIPTKNGLIDVLIHEPSMTSDNLGLKTWAASYLLAQRLAKVPLSTMITSKHITALELGSGTGLVGIAAAAVLGVTVYLSDLPEIHNNLRRNVERNLDVVRHNNGKLITGVLDWSNPRVLELSACPGSSERTIEHKAKLQFPLILAADTIYSSEHPKMLATVIESWLERSEGSKVLLELPRRRGFGDQLEQLVTKFEAVGLMLLMQEEDIGYDDWGDASASDDEKSKVECWFSIWGWKGF
jgi:predicted nicotinamide N-methyase